MNEKQTAQVIKQIDAVYPGKLDLSPDTVQRWHRYMKNQDYDKVMERLDAYTIENKFPPTVADLYEKYRPEREKGYTNQKLKQWEAEASGPPQRRS